MRLRVQALKGIALGIVLLAAPWWSVAGAADGHAYAADKLRGDLADVVAGTAEGELIPVTIIMRDQADRAEVWQAGDLHNKRVRRAAVRRILKSVAERSQEELLTLLRAGQQTGAVGPTIRPLWIHNVIGARLTADMVRQVAARDDVAYVNYDRPVADVFPVEPPSDLLPGPLPEIECGVDLMGAPRVWNELDITGRGVVVAVIDTGCCIVHPDLEHQIWVNPGEIPGNGVDDEGNGFIDDVNGWNFEDNNNDIDDLHYVGHGTHTSGTVAGDGTNGQTTGMAPGCQVMVCKFWNSFSGEQSVWDSMQYAVDNDADIISASLGWPHAQGPDRYTWRVTCENAMAAGLAVIYAAGNEHAYYEPPDEVRTPGDVPDMITVGATDCSDGLASFSSWGPVTWQDVWPWYDWGYPPGKVKPSVAAPGVQTLSTSNEGACVTYRYLDGTSMATPHVAGAAALILEANPSLDHFQVKEILMNTAVDLGPDGIDNQYGAGRVDAYEAVLEALAQTPCPGDLDGDGDTDQQDLGVLLADYGCTSDCAGDLDGDDDTDQQDLGILLADYGCTP
jgi:serine protease AprX